MDFKSYIDEVIKTYADTITKGKKRSKFSATTTSSIQSLYAKSPNPCVLFDQFGKIKYFNNSFAVMLKNDKNQKELNSIYDMFTIDAEYTYESNRLSIVYDTGFKKIFEINKALTNIEQTYLIHLDFIDITRLSVDLEKEKAKSARLTTMLANRDGITFSTNQDLFISFSIGSSPFTSTDEESPNKSLIDSNIFEIFPTTFCNEIKATLEKGGSSFTYNYKNSNKEMVFETKIYEYKDEYLFVIKDISNLRSMSNALNYLSNYDVLTGFLNSNNLSPALESISSYTYLPIGVEKISFCNIKAFNEKASYETGDEIIKTLSKKIKSIITGFDITCRLSGEEFAIIFPNTSKTFLRGFKASMHAFFNEIKEAYPEHEICFSMNSLFLNDSCESYKDEILEFLL